MTFAGFSKDTLTFLRELEKNNDKSFFDANKGRFEKAWIDPARQFVVEVGERIVRFAPNIEFAPKVGGSLLRMNRDIRFSKDKTPYKTHLDCFFWDGENKGFGRPGFFFRLTKNELLCGAGIYAFEKDALQRYREAVADASSGPKLAKLVAQLRAKGQDVGREDYKRVPKPWTAEHPRAQLLRYGGLHAGHPTKVPPEFTTPAFVDHVVERFKETAPIHRWLVEMLD